MWRGDCGDTTDKARAIDVIVPVYKGQAETRRCIESVLAGRHDSRNEVVVIDDASPEPQVSEYVNELSRQGRITLLRNDGLDRGAGFAQRSCRSVDRQRGFVAEHVTDHRRQHERQRGVHRRHRDRLQRVSEPVLAFGHDDDGCGAMRPVTDSACVW